MKHIIELTAKYKIGHQQFTTDVAVIGRNIMRVERVPEETPDHQDGVNCRVQISVGEYISVTQPYDEVVKLWHAAMEESL